MFNTYEPRLYWLNLAIARSFTTAVAERREEIFWSICVAAGRDLRNKTGDNSDELMVLLVFGSVWVIISYSRVSQALLADQFKLGEPFFSAID